jgi:CDP-2,3-bis-(O-geranylgeranyl)-sn-glycerol synthase
MGWLRFVYSGLIDSLFFFLPAVVYNLSVYLLSTLALNKQIVPLDANLMLRNNRLIGANRGIDGIWIALLSGILVGALQGRTLEGIYLAVGANFGCVVNSFLKRRLGLNEGAPFIPLDNIDFLVGAAILHASNFKTDLVIVANGVFFAGILHFLTNITIRRVLEAKIIKRK